MFSKHGFATFVAKRARESMLAEKVVQGPKNRNFDREISALLKVSDARSLYYSRLQSFQ
jgi:hypothetical protein